MKTTLTMQRKISLLAVMLFLFSTAVFAQTGSIKGFVYDKKTGEPIIASNIFVTNGKGGVQTDNNGYFSLTLPSGSYTLLITTLGYDSSFLTINLLPDAIVNKKIFLEVKNRELKDVTVSGRKVEKSTRINTGVTKITPQEMKKLPSTGGEPDLAQYLQVIPGVVFTGDQGGQLYIRGGSPAQTGIYLDGVTIYNPFHSIGLFSVFETEAVRSADVYTAGYGAQYGNRTSAIVDVHYKDGNKNDLAGVVSVSPIMSRIMLEGPLVKSKKVDNGSGVTFLLTGKTSYLDQTSKSLYSSLGDVFKYGLPYKFSDVYGKVTFNGDNGSKLNLFGFNFDDHASLLNTTTHQKSGDYHWKNFGTGATFVVSPASTTSLIDGKFAYSKYDITLAQFGNPFDTIPSTSAISGFESAINFTYFLGYDQIKYGVEVNGTHTALNYYSSAGVSTTHDRQSTTASLYFLYRHIFNSKFIFEPSMRVQYYSEVNKISPQPRLGIKYNINTNIRLKAAAGVYAQNIISTKNDRDIVNLFTGFLLSPDERLKDADGKDVKTNLQTAYHAVAGVEIDIDKVELNVEPWIKVFGQIDELNRNRRYFTDASFVAASGKAFGCDISAKYNHNRVYLWGAMGYQEVYYTSIDATGSKQTYPTPFDTRLNANALVSYNAGKKKDWDLSVRMNVHAPFPFTQTQGFYENINLAGSGLSTDPLSQSGTIGIVYADKINGGRLSWYHRLDISAKKHFAISKKTSIDATAALTNAYNRNNIFYVNRTTNERIYQLPLFPSVNVTWNF